MRLIAISGALLAAGTCVTAQDLRRARPQPVPPQAETEGDMAQAASPADVGTVVAAQPGEEILIPALRGVVFLSDPKDVRASGFASVHGVDVTRANLIRETDFAPNITPLLGKPVSLESIGRLQSVVRVYLRAKDHPFAMVYTPEQDITDGVLQVVVQPSRLDPAVRVEGAHWFREDDYRQGLSLRPGDLIDVAALNRDVAWINRNPFRHVTPVAEPGAEPGTTQLTLRAEERFPLRVYGGYDNTGTETTDEDRLLAGFNWGNVFGLGHLLTYEFRTDPGFEFSQSHSGSYSIDLPWRHSLVFYGAYADILGDMPAPFDLSGTSWQVGLVYSVPLPELWKGMDHQFSLGFDFKSSDNTLEFSLMPVTDNLTHIFQWNAGYEITQQDRCGSTSLGGTLFFSPGDLDDENTDEAYNISRAGAEADYIYGRLHLIRSTKLPARISWNLRAELQLSNKNLLGSEQLPGGGYRAVRGYAEDELFGDNGVVVNNEILFPSFSIASLVGLTRTQDEFQFLVFHDYGDFWNTDRLEDERSSVELQSVGVGFRYRIGSNFNMRLDYGWQLADSVRDDDRSGRCHLAATISF